MHETKHIHIIGICGVLTSALGIALHRKGWKVTGSDKGFYPPVSTFLKDSGVAYYAGWHPDKMVENGVPDMVVAATASGTQNPETSYAKDHNIPIFSAVEIFRDYFIREHSIVCVGTWGKTSSTALLSFILAEAGLDPTYMFGAVSQSHDAAAKLTASAWSIFEGDEYKSSPTDNSPKFFHYKPTHVLFTAVSWDHADLYPTEGSYFAVFRDLVKRIPAEPRGKIVACVDREPLRRLLEEEKVQFIGYGKRDGNSPLYGYDTVSQSEKGLAFDIVHAGATYHIESPMLGAFQAENITGCFAMAHSIGIDPGVICKAVAGFKGIKRRLEKRFEGDVTVFDDIAHSPEKANSVLSTLRSVYKGKIFAIFEPNIGGRRIEAKDKYTGAFIDADEIIIPHLTKLKVAEDEKDQPLEGDELTKIIAESHPAAYYIEYDETLVQHLALNAKKGDVIVFLGSHGFRNMIEEVVRRLKIK
jgi:UDP-N-acetylmuramate: L-alanyl-gamma-D-glutamyl-meso-diaminopimelate ligase